ncbi:MAG: hypothetical protein DVB25_04960 [Verrucomicrobia bacterium]|nr:MAG: hypothetical protein DVB25_04960 [Verrucomicrobiota bacterium]
MRKSPRNQHPSFEALMYEDVSLTHKYSVMEIAMLAAGCKGETRGDQINEAVQLLVLVERYALNGRETRLNIRDQKKASKAAEDKSSALRHSQIKEQFQKVVEIRDAATRDKKTGKIELTSLIGLAYEAATGRKADSSDAMRHFNEWAKEEASEEGVTVDEFKARFKSGSKLFVIHDDQMACRLGMEFMGYLGKAPRRQSTKIIRSKKSETEGLIVSPKTRGSDIADGTEGGVSKAGKPRKRGQFKPKPPVEVEERENSGRSFRSRMSGDHSD